MLASRVMDDPGPAVGPAPLPGPTPPSLSAPAARRGRFAPSPSGPLHRGSIVAALGSWLDARAVGGQWLLRIEDIDPPREQPGAAATIVAQLNALDLKPDGDVLYQSSRSPAYAAALDRLAAAGLIYGCRCTRRDAAHWPRSPTSGEAIYPGSCRDRDLLGGRDWRQRPGLAIRWRLPDQAVEFIDRRLGPQHQQPLREAGDPVLRRADGLWGYQLAVVVDDAATAISDVVRGEDLLAQSGRQMLLADALGWTRPHYLHLPLVVDASGRKLSKHEGAAAAGLDAPLATLADAATTLGLQVQESTPADHGGLPIRTWLEAAVAGWRKRYPAGGA